jgi:UDP-N-acetylglucosamine 1-carboxyvinyltransferase
LDAFLIEGQARLAGEVRISGAKNAALPAMAAALLTEGAVALADVPGVADIRTMQTLLRGMGVVIEGKDGRLSFDASAITSTEAPYELVRTMRAAILVLGPLLGRFGEAHVSLPGGCAIGARPVDLHLRALEAMGAKIAVEKGYITAHVSRVGRSSGRLHGAVVAFPSVTVTGTENVMLAASLARGTTRIENAAKEPEVVDLAALLARMGARVRGAGTPVIEVEGVDHLRGTGSAPHAVVPDRIETGTYLAAAAITGGEVTVENARAEDLEAFLAALAKTGAEVVRGDGRITVRGSGERRAVDVETSPHPGFPTDLQAQFMALVTRARGTSRIVETIFENRFLHASELMRLGASIELSGSTAVVHGVERLEGAPVTASDLRASAALVLAGLAAEGQTLVRRIYHLDRGYDSMERKLNALGARVTRLQG